VDEHAAVVVPVEAAVPEFANVADWVTHQAGLRPESVALVQPGAERRALSWADLESQVASVAAGLAGHGLIAGHRVALLSRNSMEFVIAYFAILRAGFVAVPMDPHSSDSEIQTVLDDSGARVLLSAGDRDFSGVRALPLTESGLAELAADGVGPVSSPVDRESLAVLLYTAGTSGDAKAVMLTQRALLSHQDHVVGLRMFDERTVVLAVLPLFHVFGLNAVLGSWVRAGGTAVVVDGLGNDLLTVMEAEHVDNLPVAPSILYHLLRLDDQHATPSSELHTRSRTTAKPWAEVSMVVSGAAPLPWSLSRAFTERTGLRVEQGYGLTEAAPGVTATIGGEIIGPGHVGRPLPGVDLRIGDGGDEAEPDEIWIRGDNLFSGYWPDGRGGPDSAGWFATGDIGYRAGGELFLVDRARELIVVNGFHVYPAEVEQVIQALPGVEEVAVIGRDHPGSGEEVVAFVAGPRLSVDQVLEHCASTLARFKRPTAVYLVNGLPRGATGKVKKGALRLMSMARPVQNVDEHG